MATTFECPACGAAQQYHGGTATSVQCPYCGTTVVVPPELRPAAAPPRPPAVVTGPSYSPWPQARRPARRGLLGCSGCGCLGVLLFFVLLMGGLLYIFGISIKTNTMYTCAVAAAQQNSNVIQQIGAPITPALFAWINNYESAGDYEIALFSTDLSGPKGTGTLQVNGTRQSNRLTLHIAFIKAGRSISISSDGAPCR